MNTPKEIPILFKGSMVRAILDDTKTNTRRIVNKMPGGLEAFCSQWGWLTFARKIERAHRIQ